MAGGGSGDIGTIVAARVCGFIYANNRTCDILAHQYVTLADLRNSSVILIGGGNNLWTQQLTGPLRYHFQPLEQASDVPFNGNVFTGNVIIVGQTGAGATSVFKIESDSKFGSDYAILARFFSQETNGLVIAAAGLSPLSTDSAGQYLSSPEKIKEIFSQAPKGWKGINFEAIIRTEKVEDNAGPTQVVATYFW